MLFNSGFKGLKYSVLIFVEKIYIKCNSWRVAVRPSYIQNARFLKVKCETRSLLKKYLVFNVPAGLSPHSATVNFIQFATSHLQSTCCTVLRLVLCYGLYCATACTVLRLVLCYGLYQILSLRTETTNTI